MLTRWMSLRMPASAASANRWVPLWWSARPPPNDALTRANAASMPPSSGRIAVASVIGIDVVRNNTAPSSASVTNRPSTSFMPAPRPAISCSKWRGRRRSGSSGATLASSVDIGVCSCSRSSAIDASSASSVSSARAASASCAAKATRCGRNVCQIASSTASPDPATSRSRPAATAGSRRSSCSSAALAAAASLADSASSSRTIVRLSSPAASSRASSTSPWSRPLGRKWVMSVATSMRSAIHTPSAASSATPATRARRSVFTCPTAWAQPAALRRARAAPAS